MQGAPTFKSMKKVSSSEIFLSVLHFVGSLLSVDHRSELDAPHYLLLNLAPDKGPSDQTSA